MNGKQARKLRKQVAKNLGPTEYQEGWRSSIWGELPKKKDKLGKILRSEVDWERWKEIKKKVTSVKWKGFGPFWSKELRYSVGIPKKMTEECDRYKYKQLKKQFNVA